MEPAVEHNILTEEYEPDILNFKYLPSFAAFILQQHVKDFAQYQLQLLKELNAPLMQILAVVPEAILLEKLLQNTALWLTAFADNEIAARIRDEVDKWLSDGFPLVRKDDVQPEDIAALFYVRKKGLIKFLPFYDNGKSDVYNIIGEIDEYIHYGTTVANKAYVHLLHKSINIQQKELLDAQKAAQQSIEQLKYSDALYRESQKLSQIGSWVWTQQTNEVMWTDELYNIYNLPKNEHPAFDTLFSPCHPDDKDMVINYIKNAIETGEQQDFNYRIVLTDRIKTLHARTEILKDEKETIKVLGMVQDISNIIRIEQELYHKNELLRQSNKSLEEFAYIASHDLREPLRKISAFAGMLNQALRDRATLTERMYINKMIESSIRMQTMIDDLLSLSRISADSPFELYSLQAIFDEVMQNLEFKIEEKKAIVTTDNLPVAPVNPVQFRQLFQNLISNSLKFSRENVTPNISITHHKLSVIEKEQLSLKRNEKYLLLQFRDNGIGFDNEYSEKIFQMFQRLHGRSEYEGTGIGLAICKRIVDHHKGYISATAVPGKGAVFTIIIPA